MNALCRDVNWREPEYRHPEFLHALAFWSAALPCRFFDP